MGGGVQPASGFDHIYPKQPTGGGAPPTPLSSPIAVVSINKILIYWHPSFLVSCTKLTRLYNKKYENRSLVVNSSSWLIILNIQEKTVLWIRVKIK